MTVCVILGAGGFARETYWHARQAQGVCYERFVFVDDMTGITSLEVGGVSWPVEKEWSFEKHRRSGDDLGFIVSIGDPQGKKILVEKALRSGLAPLPSIIHQSAVVQDPNCRIGRGGIIAPRCVLTTNIGLGDYVTLNVAVSIGHDSVLEDYVTCAPGVAIAGNVLVRAGSSLGIGSVIREKTSIALNVTTGAQACVVKDIAAEGVTVVGVPAAAIKGG